MRFAAILLLATVALVGQDKGKQAPQGPIHVVTYVDVYGNFADEAAAILGQFAKDSMKDRGAVRFEVMRDISRANHFAIVEVWQSREAFEAHTALPHTKAVREKLQPSLGSPYDERIYNALP